MLGILNRILKTTNTLKYIKGGVTLIISSLFRNRVGSLDNSLIQKLKEENIYTLPHPSVIESF